LPRGAQRAQKKILWGLGGLHGRYKFFDVGRRVSLLYKQNVAGSETLLVDSA